MEILIVSGFLGAGKTTFIQEMAKQTGRQYVIVENEFSDINIDGPLLSSEKVEGFNDTAALDLTEISEGCICCSSTIDFSSTVVTISNTLDPDYLLVEPSGVAFPSQVINTLKPIMYERIGVLDPITILDGNNYNSAKVSFPDYFYDQVNTAKHLIVSKSENLSEDEFLDIKNELNISDDVNYPLTHYKNWSKKDWTSLFTKEGKNIIKSEINIEDSLDNMGFKPFTLRNPDQLIYLLEELSTGKYGYIYRAKGFCTDEKNWFRFDFVNGDYQIGQCEEMEDSRAVVIGSNLDKKKLNLLFKFRGFSSKSGLKKIKIKS